MDLAQGHIAALVAASLTVNPNGEPFHAYNFGSDTGMAVVEVVSSFEKAFNLKVPVVLAPRLDGYVGFCVTTTLHASCAETELAQRLSLVGRRQNAWKSVPRTPPRRWHHSGKF
jgi:UDP-glucose 4-epimerase